MPGKTRAPGQTPEPTPTGGTAGPEPVVDPSNASANEALSEQRPGTADDSGLAFDANLDTSGVRLSLENPEGTAGGFLSHGLNTTLTLGAFDDDLSGQMAFDYMSQDLSLRGTAGDARFGAGYGFESQRLHVGGGTGDFSAEAGYDFDDNAVDARMRYGLLSMGGGADLDDGSWNAYAAMGDPLMPMPLELIDPMNQAGQSLETLPDMAGPLGDVYRGADPQHGWGVGVRASGDANGYNVMFGAQISHDLL